MAPALVFPASRARWRRTPRSARSRPCCPGRRPQPVGDNGVRVRRDRGWRPGRQGRPRADRAFYATAFYNAGDTNAGAIATVACDADETDYVAISGGVQVLGLDEGANSRNTPVSSSFPGRMDWDTNTPKPDRLDGWIVQFGGNAGATSDKAPEKIKVWALCVPGASIPVNRPTSRSADPQPAQHQFLSNAKGALTAPFGVSAIS